MSNSENRVQEENLKKAWIEPEIEALILNNDPHPSGNDFVLNAGNDYVS